MIKDAGFNTCIKTCQELPERSGNKGWVGYKIIILNKVRSWNTAWPGLMSEIPLHGVCVSWLHSVFSAPAPSVFMPQHFPLLPPSTSTPAGFAWELNTGCSSIEFQQEIAAEGLTTWGELFPAAQWDEEASMKCRLPGTGHRPGDTQPCANESPRLHPLPLQRRLSFHKLVGNS